MTQEQYETFENYQFLSEKEKDHERELNAKNKYGLTFNQMITLTRKHKAARKIGDYKTMTKIEYRLTGINFHSMCSQLYNGEYSIVVSDIKRKREENKLKLHYIGIGSLDKPAYKDNNGNIWLDINLGNGEPDLHKSSNNEIDGEPDYRISSDYTIVTPAPQESPLKFEYMMLSRLQADCNYYLGYGRRHLSRLIDGSVNAHIEEMKRIWNGFPMDGKPEWLTMDEINKYEKEMLHGTGNIFIDGWSTV